MSQRGKVLARILGLGGGLGLGLGLVLLSVAPPRPAAAAEAPPSPAVPGGYAGADACAACHAPAAAVWRASAHARAGASLSQGERARRACQACHATGDAPAAPAARLGVECEACHGAGADYLADDVMRDPVLARALGLRELGSPAQREALCRSCHDADRTAFDAEAAWRRIAH